MISAKGKRPKEASIGDIIEVDTPEGFRYLQYTHNGGTNGELVRVLPGFYSVRPDAGTIAKEKELYFVFYTLNIALRDGKATVVANEPVPEIWLDKYPIMRHCAYTDESGYPVKWRIISAASGLTLNELRGTPLFYQLSPEQRKLSIFEIWSHSVMTKELSRNWMPEDSEKLRLADIATVNKGSHDGDLSEDHMRHFIYFTSEANYESAKEWLHSRGFFVAGNVESSGVSWFILASKKLPQAAELIESQIDEVKQVAADFNGEYDGWEAPLNHVAHRASVQ